MSLKKLNWKFKLIKFTCPKGDDNMDRAELQKRLEEHLNFLEKTAQNAANVDNYIGVVGISKQILETVKLLDDYS